MRYRYYIVNSVSGDINCTNDEQVAEEVSENDDCYVIDVEKNQHIQMTTVGERHDIKPFEC